MLYFLICISILLLTLLIIQTNKISKIKKHQEQNLSEKIIRLRNELDENQAKWRELELQHKQKINQIEDEYQKDKRILEENRAQRDKYINESKANWDAIANQYYQTQRAELNTKLINEERIKRAALDSEYERYSQELKDQLITKQEEFDNNVKNYVIQLNDLEQKLNEYKAKQDAINEEILRKRKVEDNLHFFTVDIDKQDKNDLDKLITIKSQLSRPSILDKIIYDAYVAKPVNDMIKRVLSGTKPCGIYKITRLSTGEIYIGQSTDVATRWQQHCKSAFDVGTISQSVLHTTMKQDGLFNNFTFELLELVSKDQLHEREKYWIDYYNTKKYGLNQREG